MSNPTQSARARAHELLGYVVDGGCETAHRYLEPGVHSRNCERITAALAELQGQVVELTGEVAQLRSEPDMVAEADQATGMAETCGEPCMFCRGETLGPCALAKGHPDFYEGVEGGKICRCANHDSPAVPTPRDGERGKVRKGLGALRCDLDGDDTCACSTDASKCECIADPLCTGPLVGVLIEPEFECATCGASMKLTDAPLGDSTTHPVRDTPPLPGRGDAEPAEGSPRYLGRIAILGLEFADHGNLLAAELLIGEKLHAAAKALASMTAERDAALERLSHSSYEAKVKALRDCMAERDAALRARDNLLDREEHALKRCLSFQLEAGELRHERDALAEKLRGAREALDRIQTDHAGVKGACVFAGVAPCPNNGFSCSTCIARTALSTASTEPAKDGGA